MYGVKITHDDCETCHRLASHVLMAAEFTKAQEVSTNDGECLVTAVLWTDEDYESVWLDGLADEE